MPTAGEEPNAGEEPTAGEELAFPSEVENMFFRYKNLIGDELKARNENSRRVESVITCNILNQFRLLGSPQSKLVA